jgi:hypothetical protein
LRLTALVGVLMAGILVLSSSASEAGSASLDNTNLVRCGTDGRIESSSSQAFEPRELAIGEWATVPAVCPGELYFPSGVLVTPGATYRISAQGMWKDLWIHSGPQGWNGLLLQAGNRLRWGRMFALCGSIGEDDEQIFLIGSGRDWTAPATLPEGSDLQLYLFPNDWKGMYHNNRALEGDQGGPMRVTIRRLS